MVVESLSRVGLSANPWAAARQASLSFAISWGLLRFMSMGEFQNRIQNHFLPHLSVPSRGRQGGDAEDEDAEGPWMFPQQGSTAPGGSVADGPPGGTRDTPPPRTPQRWGRQLAPVTPRPQRS